MSADDEAGARLAALEAAIGYAFRDPELAATALRHASFAHEAGEGPSNERLEFLGDAVLGFVAAEIVYCEHPEWSEGALTRARAALVNGTSLARGARALGLGPLLRLGRTEQRSGGEDKDRILANGFEAVLGAVYLDGGLGPAAALARRSLAAAGTRSAGAPRDPKTAFQEWAHARFRRTPSYRTARDSGIEDDPERFTVEVCIDEEPWGEGSGRSKRVAERRAAEQALRRSATADA